MKLHNWMWTVEYDDAFKLAVAHAIHVFKALGDMRNIS